QLRHHPHGAGLAVRARDVNDRKLFFRRTEIFQERGDALERGGAARSRRRHADAGLQVDVRVQPAACVEGRAVGHGFSGGARSTFPGSSGPTSISSTAILPASQTSLRAASSAATRSAVSRTTTRSTSVASERFCSDFSLRTAPSTSDATAYTSGSALA